MFQALKAGENQRSVITIAVPPILEKCFYLKSKLFYLLIVNPWAVGVNATYSSPSVKKLSGAQTDCG